MIVSPLSGTTRDSIFIPFERDKYQYTLIDTAGVRRKKRIDNTVALVDGDAGAQHRRYLTKPTLAGRWPT